MVRAYYPHHRLLLRYCLWHRFYQVTMSKEILLPMDLGRQEGDLLLAKAWMA
jgi:hypothetical protein